MKQLWYQNNRERVIQRSKEWQQVNRERHLEHMRAYRARKKAEKQRFRWKMAEMLPVAPEGYDPACGETVQNWCLQHNVPFDPKMW